MCYERLFSASHGNNFIGMLKMSPIKACVAHVRAPVDDNISPCSIQNNQFHHRQSPATSKPRPKIVSIRWQRRFHSNEHIFQSVIYHEIRDKRFWQRGLFKRRPYCVDWCRKSAGKWRARGACLRHGRSMCVSREEGVSLAFECW